MMKHIRLHCLLCSIFLFGSMTAHPGIEKKQDQKQNALLDFATTELNVDDMLVNKSYGNGSQRLNFYGDGYVTYQSEARGRQYKGQYRIGGSCYIETSRRVPATSVTIRITIDTRVVTFYAKVANPSQGIYIDDTYWKYLY